MSRAFTPPDTLSPDDIRTVADVRRAIWINGLFGLGAGSVLGMGCHIALQSLQKKYISSVDGPSSSTSAAASNRKTSNASSWIYKCLKPLPPLGKNTFLLSLLGGGALGSFVLSTTAGECTFAINVICFACMRVGDSMTTNNEFDSPWTVHIQRNFSTETGVNNVHVLHPIFNLGRNENAGKSPYQILTTTAKDEDIRDPTTSITASTKTNGEDELDAAHHRNRSIRRQASMKRRLESGGSLSDAHSNTWPSTNEEEPEDIQKGRAMHRAEFWGKRQTHRRQVVQDRIEHGKALSNSTGGNWCDGESEEHHDEKQ